MFSKRRSHCLLKESDTVQPLTTLILEIAGDSESVCCTITNLESLIYSIISKSFPKKFSSISTYLKYRFQMPPPLLNDMRITKALISDIVSKLGPHKASACVEIPALGLMKCALS